MLTLAHISANHLHMYSHCVSCL